MFTDNLKVWKILPAIDRTWTRFKHEFSLAHQDLRENTAVGRGAFGQVNTADQDTEIAEVMAKLATTTAADRSIVTTLSATIECLIDQLATANS